MPSVITIGLVQLVFKAFDAALWDLSLLRIPYSICNLVIVVAPPFCFFPPLYIKPMFFPLLTPLLVRLISQILDILRCHCSGIRTSVRGNVSLSSGKLLQHLRTIGLLVDHQRHRSDKVIVAQQGARSRQENARRVKRNSPTHLYFSFFLFKIIKIRPENNKSCQQAAKIQQIKITI